MKRFAKDLGIRLPAMLLALMLTLLVAHDSTHAQERVAFSQQELERTLAPIALYPDPLLSQILMAATYPLEVVEAARWSRSHAGLAGEDAVRAAESENWDPSVKSLLAFPQVLARMEENLQWLQTLGDAFLAQEPQVMDTVQTLRRRAQAAGNLRSDERQRIIETGPLLIVQPADPQIIYVPYYDPRIVFGHWRWPQHAPVYWRPFPGYYAWPGLTSGFLWGPSIRISINYFFGDFDWSHRHVRVVQHNHYYRPASARTASVVYSNRSPGAWQHDPVHRRGVAYRSANFVPHLAAENIATQPIRRSDRENTRRHDGQHVHAHPTPNRYGAAVRPFVPAAVQSTGKMPATPEIQKASRTQTDAGTDQRAERRDHVKGRDNRSRNPPFENRQTTAKDDAIPQPQGDRGHAARPHAVAQTSLHGERNRRQARAHEGKSGQEPGSSPASRQEARR